MTTHPRPERRSLFPDGADLPLFTMALEHTITADLITDCEPRPLTKAPAPVRCGCDADTHKLCPEANALYNAMHFAWNEASCGIAEPLE